MNLAPVTIEHGKRFGKLTVLRKITSAKRAARYQCGCDCGCSDVYVKPRQLLSRTVTACRVCTKRASLAAASPATGDTR